MYRLKKIWLTFRTHISMYVYAWIQFTLIMCIITGQVAKEYDTYNALCFLESYDKDMYMYSNVMLSAYRQDTEESLSEETSQQMIYDDETSNEEELSYNKEQQLIETIAGIDGVKAVGYELGLPEYTLTNGTDEEYVIYVNESMKKLSYKNIEGKWLDEAPENDSYIPVVIGYNIALDYQIGDTFTIEQSDGEKKECKVIGIVKEDAATFDLNMSGSSKSLPPNYGYENAIYTADDRVLEGMNKDECIYPSMNLLLELEEDYDAETLKIYGNLYSLKYMEEESEKEFVAGIMDTINWYGIILFVSLFGAFGTIYLIQSKNVYDASIYHLLGMTKGQMVAEQVIIHLILYISAIPVIRLVYLKLYELVFGAEILLYYQWCPWNMIAIGIIVAILILIAAIVTACMIKDTPKNMMIRAKNMEN